MSGLAAAVDLGTTTVAVRLYELAGGRELKTISAWNAQAAYGGDVISRIQYTMEIPNGLNELSRIIRAQVEDMISRALEDCGKASRSFGTPSLSATPSCSTYLRLSPLRA